MSAVCNGKLKNVVTLLAIRWRCFISLWVISDVFIYGYIMVFRRYLILYIVMLGNGKKYNICNVSICLFVCLYKFGQKTKTDKRRKIFFKFKYVLGNY